MSINNQLQDLLEAEVIDQQTASKIKNYYKSKESNNSNRVLVIFGVLGALLVGLGIILILAHNWDTLPKFIKTILAFIPMIIGQFLCGYSLHNNKEKLWKESSAVFLTLAIGACISLVSQIYNLEGDLKGFIMIWMILAIPVIYLMESSITSLIYIIASSWFGAISSESAPVIDFFTYAILLGAVIPFYVHQIKHNWQSNALTFHHFLIPVSLLFGISGLAFSDLHLNSWIYINAFGLFYMLGATSKFRALPLRSNGYTIIGALGAIAIIMFYTFDFNLSNTFSNMINEGENPFITIASISITFLLGLLGLIYHYKNESLDNTNPTMPVFLIFGFIFFTTHYIPYLGVFLMNLLVLFIAVSTILAGIKKDHLGILNYGLLILTTLLICRFFDSNITFVLRGILFIIVGAAFFAANNFIIKKRKAYDQ